MTFFRSSGSFIRFFTLVVTALGCAGMTAQEEAALKPQTLPTGMMITPTAARGSVFLPLNPDLPHLPDVTVNDSVDHPVSTALSPDGNTLLVLTSGYNRMNDTAGKAIPWQSNEYVFVYDVRQRLPFKRQVLQVPNTFIGITWNPDGREFYVSGGKDDNVHIFKLVNGGWAEPQPPILLDHKAGLGKEVKPVAVGVAVNSSGTRLLVANYENDSVSLIDLKERKKIAELDLRPGADNPAQHGVPGGEYPYWVTFKGDDKAYVSSLRDREIVVLDVRAEPRVSARIKVQGQPNKMILNRAQTRLFAAADYSNSVVMIYADADRFPATIKTSAPS